jgi:hypothetical protein
MQRGGEERCAQWGRRLEGWPNTAARLAGWRRVTRQGVIFMWWTVYAACTDGPHPFLRSGVDLLLNVHKIPSWATSRKKDMARYLSRSFLVTYGENYGIDVFCTFWGTFLLLIGLTTGAILRRPHACHRWHVTWQRKFLYIVRVH